MCEIVKQQAIDWITNNKDLIINTHNAIWDYAELRLKEYKSAQLLIDILEKYAFTIEPGIAGIPTAFVATYGTGHPVIGVIGEYDALPGLSQKAVPWKEPLIEGAPGHGCGHVAYSTSALGGILATKRVMEANNIHGTIKYFGCPAEETLVGKVFMLREGCFDGVDVFLGHHPGQVNSAILRSLNALNSVKFEFHGVSSHAASSPEQGRSALDAVELMNIGVNFLREHIVQEARIHYIIDDGGTIPNVVPDYARVWYYIRAPTRELVNMIYDRILGIADGADLMVGTTHNVIFLTGVHETIPNRTLAELAVMNMRKIGPPTYTKDELEFARVMGETIDPEQKKAVLHRSGLPNWMDLMNIDLDTQIHPPFGDGMRGGGSSDIAEVSWNAPTQEFSTGMFVIGAPGHSWQNVAIGGTSIGHKISIFASKVFATTILDILMNPDVLKNIKKEWEERMMNKVYVSPIPKDIKLPNDDGLPNQ